MIKAAKTKKKGEIVKTETLRHQEAFNYYYLLGSTRTLLKISHLTGVNITTLKSWSRSFNWQKRIIERDKKNAAAIEKATDKKLVADKIEYRTQVKELLIVLREAIQVAVNTMRSGGVLYDAGGNKVLVSKFSCNTADGLSKVSAAIERLMRLDLTLMGEPERKEQLDILWKYVDGDGETPKIIDSETVDTEFEKKNDNGTRKMEL